MRFAYPIKLEDFAKRIRQYFDKDEDKKDYGEHFNPVYYILQKNNDLEIKNGYAYFKINLEDAFDSNLDSLQNNYEEDINCKFVLNGWARNEERHIYFLLYLDDLFGYNTEYMDYTCGVYLRDLADLYEKNTGKSFKHEHNRIFGEYAKKHLELVHLKTKEDILEQLNDNTYNEPAM
jgi:hypothetical protein